MIAFDSERVQKTIITITTTGIINFLAMFKIAGGDDGEFPKRYSDSLRAALPHPLYFYVLNFHFIQIILPQQKFTEFI